MTRYPQIPSLAGQHKRGGVTISEVLISMVIMAVGVVSLATLFPASVLRSIQASQLTNSALVSKNARARIVYDTTILSNINFPFTIPVAPSKGSLDPANPPEMAVIDPFGKVIDPKTNASKYNLPNNIAGVNRISGGPSTVQFVENLAMLPDSWSLVRQDNVTGGYTSGSHQLVLAAPPSDFTDITPRTLTGTGSTLPLYRLTILDPTGKFAFRRTVRQVLNGNALSWVDPSGPFEPDLPSAFTPAKCRIEVRDNRYTWMLTVRKRPLDSSFTSWKADADLAVFFNRSFKASDEGIDSTGAALATMSVGASGGFDGQPGVSGIDDDLDGTVDNNSELAWVGSDDNRSLTFPATSVPANLKKGGYLFEPNQARWYRIVSLNLKSSPNRVLLDRDLIDLPASPFSVVLMKGVVQVYELGTFTGAQ